MESFLNQDQALAVNVILEKASYKEIIRDLIVVRNSHWKLSKTQNAKCHYLACCSGHGRSVHGVEAAESGSASWAMQRSKRMAVFCRSQRSENSSFRKQTPGSQSQRAVTCPKEASSTSERWMHRAWQVFEPQEYAVRGILVFCLEVP